MYYCEHNGSNHKILYKGTSVTPVTFFKIKDTLEMAARGTTTTAATIKSIKRGGLGNGYSHSKWGEIVREDPDCELPDPTSEIERVRCVRCAKNLKIVDGKGYLQIGPWLAHKLVCTQLQCVLNTTVELAF